MDSIFWFILYWLFGIVQWIYEAIKNNFLYVAIGAGFLILLIGLIRIYFKLEDIEYMLQGIENDVNRLS
jgi:hypothetical protein